MSNFNISSREETSLLADEAFLSHIRLFGEQFRLSIASGAKEGTTGRSDATDPGFENLEDYKSAGKLGLELSYCSTTTPLTLIQSS